MELITDRMMVTIICVNRKYIEIDMWEFSIVHMTL